MARNPAAIDMFIIGKRNIASVISDIEMGV